MTDKIKSKLDNWLKSILPVFENLSKNYKEIPSPDNRGNLISQFAAQQKKLNKLLELDSDDVIHRRLINLREYTGRVLSMLTAATLNIKAPLKVSPGDTFNAILTFANPDTDIQNVQFELEAPLGWKISTCDENQIGTKAVYKITVPKTAQIHIPANLTALASFKHRHTKSTLTIVQTHGLQITDKKTQKAKKETIADDQHQKLHADPKK